MTTDLALQALLSAVWQRKQKTKVMIHFDQGAQVTSTEWQSFVRKHNLDASMSTLSADCFAIACRAMDVGIVMTTPWQKASSSF
ncbi:hypothetical protein A8B78_09520 [Jannaschia sp. EhC01]|nr:hypothetical protein A8B78_09520 [Jannaschia sp. EhC01]